MSRRQCYILATALLFLSTGLAAAAERAWVFDRIEVLNRFISVVYRDINPDIASVAFEGIVEHGQSVTMRALSLYPCRRSAEVSASPSPSVSAKPYCGNGTDEDRDDWLRATVDLVLDSKRPIARFLATGHYIDGELRSFRKQFKGKVNLQDQDVLAALRVKKPLYGPDSRNEFLSTIPTKEIEAVTGCRLDTKTAAFVFLGMNGELPEMQWHIQGAKRATRLLTAGRCHAFFEPFRGHLTLFLG